MVLRGNNVLADALNFETLLRFASTTFTTRHFVSRRTCTIVYVGPTFSNTVAAGIEKMVNAL
jgi:hypothetical protein